MHPKNIIYYEGEKNGTYLESLQNYLSEKSGKYLDPTTMANRQTPEDIGCKMIFLRKTNTFL